VQLPRLFRPATRPRPSPVRLAIAKILACPLPDGMPWRPERVWGVHLPLHRRFLVARLQDQARHFVAGQSGVDLGPQLIDVTYIAHLQSHFRPTVRCSVVTADRLGIKSGGS
jgi:hypothetical protein